MIQVLNEEKFILEARDLARDYERLGATEAAKMLRAKARDYEKILNAKRKRMGILKSFEITIGLWYFRFKLNFRRLPRKS